jgi:hypothetical protein
MDHCLLVTPLESQFTNVWTLIAKYTPDGNKLFMLCYIIRIYFLFLLLPLLLQCGPVEM